MPDMLTVIFYAFSIGVLVCVWNLVAIALEILKRDA